MARPLFEQYKDALRRGHVALLNDELDAALAAYREAAALVPDRPLPYVSIGKVLERLGRLEEEVQAYDQALAIVPDDPEVVAARAAALATVPPEKVEPEPAVQPTSVAEAAVVEPTPEVEATRQVEATPEIELTRQVEPTSGVEPTPAVELSPAVEPERAAAAVDHAAEARRQAKLAAAAEAEAAALDQMRAALEPRTEAERDAAAKRDAPAAERDEALPPAANPADGPSGSFYAERAPDVVMDAERNWPAIDLPSLPPEPFVGPPPDPGTIQVEADALLDGGDPAGARELLLVAVAVHRDSGRLDAALDACLQLLAVAPGDPRVHLAIANLQLDRGWRSVATEKIELLLRLTSLSGDAQAEADVHLLAADRLRDEDPARLDARRRGLPAA